MNYEITGANRETGASVSITIEARDFRHAEEQANDMGVVVSNVRELHDPGVSPPTNSPLTRHPTSVAHGVTCQACGGTPLVRKKLYRMSGPVVVIGYILLIPSFLGILINGLLFVAVATGLSIDLPQIYIDQMREAGISETIIDKVMNNQELTDEDIATLSRNQQELITTIELGHASSTAGACCGVGIFGIGSVLAMILCFVGGLLGWLLIMKKKVLQCVRCHAVVQAS